METAEAPKNKPPRTLLRAIVRWAKRALIVFLALGVIGVVAVVVIVRHYEEGLPSTKELKSYAPPQVTRVLARDGTVLGELFKERRTVVPIDQIPTQMKLAALAAEDASFYEHAGLNYLGMLRAILKNLRSHGAKQGASTITQQVVKNVLLTSEKTFERKVKEAILARKIEEELTKDEILELYLNQIFFGHGRFGVEEAARYYFGKSIKDVTLAEAATLAAIVKGPSIYSPRKDAARAKERRNLVLDQMADKSFAKAEQIEAAKREPITLASEVEAQSELAPEVVDEVKRALHDLVHEDAERGGYTITTTIDPALETAARKAVRKNLDDYEKRHNLLAPINKPRAKGKQRAAVEPAPSEGIPQGNRVFHGVVLSGDDTKGLVYVRVGAIVGVIEASEIARYNPDSLPPSQVFEAGKIVPVTLLGKVNEAKAIAKEDPDPVKLHLELGPEGALVAVDVRSKEILALVGSYEGLRGGLDRTRSHRQPGSTFKAFVYSYAMHARTMTPATIVETNPAALKGYKPANYDESEGRTPKRVRPALADSVNVAAAWALNQVGPENVVAWARALGIESKLEPDLSLALGSYEVTPLEMVGAYTAFASGGVYDKPILIKRIVGPNGVEVPLAPRPAARRVMEEAEAYVVTSLLTSVVTEGTAKRAKALGRPIAGKTGTSNQAKDGWFVGYSTDIACAVWTGYDEPFPMGAGEAGASLALPAFVDFMREAHKKRAVTDFPVPPGITRIAIDPETGKKAYPDQKDSMEEIFLAGTEPTEMADAGPPEAPDAGPMSDAGEAPPF
jgi:penicillin-binding protein 1A